MKKKSVNLVTAVGVLVILSGAYVGVKTYVAKQEEKESESEETDESQEILSLASDDIKSIKFVIDKKEVTFEKDGDTWVKSDESAFPVDQDKIDDLASAFRSVTAARTLENVEDPSEYELDQPENTITVTTTDGESTVIQLGMENDSTNQEYIDLNKDSSTVYVVSNSTFSSFEGSLYDFAQSGTFPTIDSSTVSKITVNENSGSTPASYVVEKDENNFWEVTGETNGDGENGKTETEKADSAKATSLASALSSMAYSSYVNYNCEDDELSQYGLDKPYAEIIADYQEEVEIQKDEDESDSAAADEADTEAENAEQETDLNETSEEDADDNANGAETGAEDATEASESESQDADTENASDEDTEEVMETDIDSEEDNEEATETTDTADTEADTSEEDEEPTTEMVDRELTILIGDQASDGGRYVKVNDSKEIYTISEDSLNTFISKTNADFWDLTVSYVSVNDLESLDVDYKGDTYTVDVSRETSEEEDDAQDDTDSSEDISVDNSDSTSSSTATTSATVALSYKLDGNDLDSTTFTTYYNKLINMAAQKRLTDKFETKADPEMEVTFNKTDGTQETVSYYSYDTNYYAAVVGEKVYLVNKMTVKEMFTAFENAAGITSETEDSDEEATSDDDATTETTEEITDAETTEE